MCEADRDSRRRINEREEDSSQGTLPTYLLQVNIHSISIFLSIYHDAATVNQLY